MHDDTPRGGSQRRVRGRAAGDLLASAQMRGEQAAMKPRTPLAQMTPERLRAELTISLKQMLAHESWRFGDCKRKCEQPWPCPDFTVAAKQFIEVARLLGL